MAGGAVSTLPKRLQAENRGLEARRADKAVSDLPPDYQCFSPTWRGYGEEPLPGQYVPKRPSALGILGKDFWERKARNDHSRQR